MLIDVDNEGGMTKEKMKLMLKVEEIKVLVVGERGFELHWVGVHIIEVISKHLLD